MKVKVVSGTFTQQTGHAAVIREVAFRIINVKPTVKCQDKGKGTSLV
jgi:hypothetical protein